MRNRIDTFVLVASFVAFAPFVGSQSIAQVYPPDNNKTAYQLKGPVKKVIESRRQYEAQTETWKPLTISKVHEFNRQGMLVREATFISRDTSQQNRRLYSYDSAESTYRPILESTVGAGSETGSPNVLLEATLEYDSEGRLSRRIVRNHQSGQTNVENHTYADNHLASIVTRDSARDAIVAIESFAWGDDDRPLGSTFWKYPAEAGLQSVSDTGRIGGNDVEYGYTSYVYDDTATPVIYWRWEFGNDTTVDRQEIKRFNDDHTLYSSTVSQFMNGEVAHTRSMFFDPYGEPISSTMTSSNGTTREQAFVYKYWGAKEDPHGNWLKRSAFASKNPTDPDAELVPTARTDRSVIYFQTQ